MDSIPGKCCQMIKEEIKLILHELFQKTEEEGEISSSTYEMCVILTPKPNTAKERK